MNGTSFSFLFAGSEDCLFINIYTPNANAGASLPVVVFIHGGAFMYGEAGVYNTKHMMDRDIVVVTFNYRLGPLGTFHRGIAFSGSAFSSWTHAVKPAQKAKTLAAIVGCPTTSTREMAECLKYRPGEVIVNAQIEMFDWRLHWFTPFTPTVEATGTRDPFLTQYPYIASKAGATLRLPLITSVTSEEGLYPAASYQADPTILPELESRWEHLASNIFEYNDTLPLHLRSSVAQKIKEKYLDGKPVGQDTFDGLVQFVRSNISKYNTLIRKLRENKKIGTETMENQNVKVPKIPNGPEWLPVKPGQAELDYLEIGQKNIAMNSSADFGNKAFWNSLGFMENENYRVNMRDEF
ncbi:jg22074 [Pararge aegeria aegeria]|uniref:Jg22074 protein n=1 Tax=Pararge aegeria aegeria TaxID=348720 RepID=A0A8S4RMW6_9NEOP|nr:jg22074 [Pararge aegeria aegeria]